MKERFRTATLYVWGEDSDIREVSRVLEGCNGHEEELVVFAKKERGFRTLDIKERFARYGLEVPYYEISFFARRDYIDKEKVRACAFVLDSVYDLEVLAVGDTTIESKQLFASDRIAEKLGISSIPGLES